MYVFFVSIKKEAFLLLYEGLGYKASETMFEHIKFWYALMYLIFRMTLWLCKY